MRSWFSGWPRRNPREVKSAVAAPVVAIQAAVRASWSSRDDTSLARSGFIGNPIGFRCIKLIAEATAAPPLVLQNDQQRFAHHPLLALLRRPNPAQGQSDLFESLFGQLLLSGNAWVEATSDDGGLPLELHVLRSDRMRIIPGSDGWPAAYEYSAGGRSRRYPAVGANRPICHLRNFHPHDDHYGLSPLQAAAAAIDVHNAASRWSKALLDNAARPSGAIVYRGGDGNGGLSSDQYDRLVSEMEAYHQGARNAGRPMLLEGGLEWKPMGFSPSDMEFQRTKETAAREIALAFGVPPMLLGIPGDATYANYQEANRAFYRLTVLPLAARGVAILTDWLSARFDIDISLVPDLDRVPALSGERDAQWARITAADFLSAEEKRRMLGLPTVSEEPQQEGK